jgi:TetR/AcrR family transcriptional regulator, regulator of cefoperazone and chloramphenicol sensitivity
MTTRKDGLETRQRIVETAVKVFADHGFHEATHVAISELAEVNTASINYHFGSKADLYVETWKYLVTQADLIHPADGGVPDDASPGERLRGRISGLICRIADRGCMGAMHGFRVKEMANPTGLLDESMDTLHRKNHDVTVDVLRDIVGPDATDLTLDLCERSIIGQCFMMRAPHWENDKGILPCNADDIADHIHRFSMAGIREICAEPEQQGKCSKSADSNEAT